MNDHSRQIFYSTPIFRAGRINKTMNSKQKTPTGTVLGKPIAHGRTADIYAWQDDNILKLFHDWFDLDSIKYEAGLAQAVQDSGLPVPKVGEIIQVDGHNGLIYQRVTGHSMMEALHRAPWMLFHYAHRQAALHAQMHSRSIGIHLPSQHQRLENKILHANALPTQFRSAIVTSLNTLTDGNRICHGDFHPGNILLTGRAEVVIDWIDATLGNPLADVARSSILALGAAATSQIPNPFMKAIIRLFHDAYIRHYFDLCPGGEIEFRSWLPVVAAARLSEGIPELETWLVALAHRGL